MGDENTPSCEKSSASNTLLTRALADKSVYEGTLDIKNADDNYCIPERELELSVVLRRLEMRIYFYPPR